MDVVFFFFLWIVKHEVGYMYENVITFEVKWWGAMVKIWNQRWYNEAPYFLNVLAATFCWTSVNIGGWVFHTYDWLWDSYMMEYFPFRGNQGQNYTQNFKNPPKIIYFYEINPLKLILPPPPPVSKGIFLSPPKKPEILVPFRCEIIPQICLVYNGGSGWSYFLRKLLKSQFSFLVAFIIWLNDFYNWWPNLYELDTNIKIRRMSYIVKLSLLAI